MRAACFYERAARDKHNIIISFIILNMLFLYVRSRSVFMFDISSFIIYDTVYVFIYTVNCRACGRKMFVLGHHCAYDYCIRFSASRYSCTPILRSIHFGTANKI